MTMTSRGTDWANRSYWSGEFQEITTLLAAGTHRIEAWGNQHDGWRAYLVSGDIGLAISPLFHNDMGDRLQDLKAAAGRCYGIDPASVKKGRGWL